MNGARAERLAFIRLIPGELEPGGQRPPQGPQTSQCGISLTIVLHFRTARSCYDDLDFIAFPQLQSRNGRMGQVNCEVVSPPPDPCTEFHRLTQTAPARF